MASQPGAWGIEIGQCALKALRVENRNGHATATAFEFVEHPKILSQPDADPDLLTREALEKFLKRNSLRGDVVAMSVSGQSGLARFVKLPPVEEKKIGDIVKFEAKQQIPFALEEVVWDYQKIGSGVVTDGFAMETEIGLFAIKRENVARALQPFQDVGVEVDIIQMAPLALCNFVAYDLLKKGPQPAEEQEGGKKECIVALDIGVDNSNLVITDGEQVIWQRPIPIGGNRFTRALTKEFKLTYAKAEHLKRNATKSPELKRILLALRPDLNEFVNEVQKSLHFFTNSQKDAHIQYLVGMGGAFRLPGLQKYLQEKLQLEVRKLQKFPRLHGDSVITAPLFNDNILSMGVVYGLALQGLGLTRLHTNLLPEEIRVERLVRSKKPWAVAAAASLLLGCGALAFSERLQHDAVASPVIVQAMKEAEDGALKEAQAAKQRFDTKKAEVDALKRSVRSIVAGQEERLNWIKLNKFINDCLPRPDGGNLLDKQKHLWDKEGGQKAYDKFMAKQSAGKLDAAGMDDWTDDLLQINLESVNALYADDLSGYLTRLKQEFKGQPPDAMPKEDQAKTPTGGGWVVEVRGFTFHRMQREFVVGTFVENLITKGKTATPTQPGKPIDPIGGKVSHVVLLNYKVKINFIPGTFELIDKSNLYTLVTGKVPGKEPDRSATLPLGQFADAPQERDRSGWKPIGNGQLGMKPKSSEDVPPPAASDTTPPKREKGQAIRTEFVVQFIWQEPTPSEGDRVVVNASTQP